MTGFRLPGRGLLQQRGGLCASTVLTVGHGAHLELAQRAVVAVLRHEPPSIRGLHGAGHGTQGAQRGAELRVEHVSVRGGEPGELLEHVLVPLVRLLLSGAREQHEHAEEADAPDQQGHQHEGQQDLPDPSTDASAGRPAPLRAAP